MPEPFWKTDPWVLIQPKYLHRFFPSSSLTLPERLNSIIRLGAYVGVGLAIVQKEMSWILLPVVAAVITMAWMDEEAFETKKRASRREKDLRFLASEIVSGRTRDTELRHRVKSKGTKRRPRSSMPSISKKVYNDLDTNLESMRNERATMRKQLDTGLSDAPGFARSMMKKDQERYRGNGSQKYSRR